MRVKICGITQSEQAIAIARHGATHLGFICVPQSPRYLTPAAIAEITNALDAAGVVTKTVGVFADATLEEMGAIARQANLSHIQLHGQESLEQCQQLLAEIPSIFLIKAIRVRTAADLVLAETYAPYVDALLLDAYHPDQLGGTGLTLDWDALVSFRPTCPWMLAGGLTPENVSTALSTLGPDGIDLSSGVEHQPGVKDLALVRHLFEQLRPWLPISAEL
ncbi:phosphoribosylanthranilate isomerase [Phormidium tenue]|uniref:N-(5'-phosphoribosyl)anthranilate isomerase n=1 Tax=Phormidium tenue NIES-30 TaxID=549789 RepID=A0A1U7J6I4_9CYAN|nr:phosphoribosylanthranilate isomerase [Phormidium tenue]MBD2233499.1 phosphoribosylanthranilate isomerase [Phormidium tenue FACHB-1052]OKH48611.1 N-(5'-phosphoribosyl)anthranilate isomerase [Phormidium tenue NIES-30]